MLAAYGLAGNGRTRREVGAALVFTMVNLLGAFSSCSRSPPSPTSPARSSRAGRVHAQQRSSPTRQPDRVVFFVAFSVKLGLFPLHFSLPTVTAAPSRPWPRSSAASGEHRRLRAAALRRRLLPGRSALGEHRALRDRLLSILYGGVHAVSRRTSSEVLAYSAVGQVGYMLVAVALRRRGRLHRRGRFAVANSLAEALLLLRVGHRGPIVGAVVRDRRPSASPASPHGRLRRQARDLPRRRGRPRRPRALLPWQHAVVPLHVRELPARRLARRATGASARRGRGRRGRGGRRSPCWPRGLTGARCSRPATLPPRYQRGGGSAADGPCADLIGVYLLVLTSAEAGRRGHRPAPRPRARRRAASAAARAADRAPPT